jgi:REP element-mobilizing transposase RayT
MNHAESNSPQPNPRSAFLHYLPRLKRVFCQADAVVFWTLHAAAREGLLCPAYCLMPDHLHLVWMGLRAETDQRNGMKFLRAQLGPLLHPARFQHQAHDHVLTAKERQQHAFSVACADYVLLNPLRAGLVKRPDAWPHLGAVVPGYPRLNPFDSDYWPWFWKHYFTVREPGLEKRILPAREME